MLQLWQAGTCSETAEHQKRTTAAAATRAKEKEETKVRTRTETEAETGYLELAMLGATSEDPEKILKGMYTGNPTPPSTKRPQVNFLKIMAK